MKSFCCNLGRAVLGTSPCIRHPGTLSLIGTEALQHSAPDGRSGAKADGTTSPSMCRGTTLRHPWNSPGSVGHNFGKVVGSIAGMKGLHGVALDDAGKFGYISDGGANSVVVFDRATLQTVATIPAGTNPDGIAFEPVTKTVWAFNGRSRNVTVIDAAERKVIATIDLPGKPEFPEADGKGVVFANIEDKNEIVRLDAAEKKDHATWPLSGCDSPSGLAIDTAGRRLFSSVTERRWPLPMPNTGKTLANPTIGDSPDAAGYDAKHKLAFSSNGDGTLTVVDASGSTYPVLQDLATQRGARTMAFDSSTDRVYLVTAEFGPRPAATAENPRPRPAVVPGSFTVLVVGR